LSEPPDSPSRVPTLSPRGVPIDLSHFEIAHPNPFICDIHVDRHQIGNVIEHVSNIEYVRWLDRAAELHADSLGCTRKWLLDNGIMWFVARHEIDYMAEAWLGDELVIATWVRDFKKVKSWRDYVIARPSDGIVICRAATLWVLVDLESRRPRRIDEEMIRRFQPLAAVHSSAPSPHPL
jgi:acyl-CoA thioester hydrolase